MPASKKRIQRRGPATLGEQKVPAALRDWVHIWHGVRVKYSATSTSIFHAGSRVEEMPFWKQFVRLPSNSLFPRVDTLANPRKPYKDFLYVLLNMRWPMLFTVLLGVFIANIFFFALATWLACGEPDSFLAAFDMSYQTFTTIGFGIVYPKRVCANVVISVESFASMMITSAITGLVFAKFAKPRAKVAFSKVCVIQPYGKKYLALVVRVANATQSRDVTHDVIMEASFKVNLLRVEKKADQVRNHELSERSSSINSDKWPKPPHNAQGWDRLNSAAGENDVNGAYVDADDVELDFTPDKVLSSYNLKLMQNNFITFRMGVAVVHVIDEESPLFGMSEHDLAQSDMIIEVAMSGVDSTLQDTVTERYVYTAANLKWGYRFAELLDFNELNAEVIMDFAKLSTIDPAPINVSQYLKPPSPPVGAVHHHRHHHHHHHHHHAHFQQSQHLEVHDELNETANAEPSNSIQAQVFEDPPLAMEVPTEFSESLMRSYSASLERFDTPTPLQVRRHSATSNKRKGLPVPVKSTMGMEPLFEPLLRPSFGTQRIRRKDSVHQLADGERPRVGGQLFQREIAAQASWPNEEQDNGASRNELLLPNHRASAGAGTNPERVIPVRQKKQLQSQLAGAAVTDEEDSSTISDVEGSDSSECEDEEEEDDDAEIQPRTSVVSIDVEDTPRFLKIAPIHIPKSYGFMRLYHSALYERWPRITIVFVLAFMIINSVFGFLYWLEAGQMVEYEDVKVSSYESAFFMSVHTLATIGYGSISPAVSSVYMNVVVFIESTVGIITTTIITGIAWSKFARPRAHIHFSSHIIITRIYGHRCLVFRAANTRHSGEVHENFFRIGVILTNRKTGLRQMYDVPLVTAEWPSIKLPATLIHIIDESSPFFRFRTTDDLMQSRVAVIALLTALDTTFSENVYARKMYFWDDFASDMRFADFALIERDRVVVDYEHFDQLIPEFAEPDEHLSPTAEFV